LFVALYAVISAVFISTTVSLSNYLTGNMKTNSIQRVSACLAFFEAIWQFFASGSAFFVHLDLATLVFRCSASWYDCGLLSCEWTCAI